MATEWRQVHLSSGNTKSDGKFCNNTIISSRYTLVTFLPKMVIEQCRKGFNIFFVTLIILQYAFGSRTNPITFVITFMTILMVTIIKQAYEDLIRHKADRIVNNRKIFVFDKTKSTFVTQKSSELKVGQIIRLEDNDSIPCDILLLRAIGNSKKVVTKCEITTANLDGEPNLKVRFCPSGLLKLESGNEDDYIMSLYKHQVDLEFDQPSTELYKFNGVIRSKSILEKPVSITMDNVLLRGTTLKNTHYVYGCILYTGRETRLSLNTSRVKKNKFSVIDHTINKIVLMLCFLLTTFIAIAMGLFFLNRDHINSSWYIPPEDQDEFGMIITTVFLFLVFLSYMVPISLSASMEFQKVGNSRLFGWDKDMTCPTTGLHAKCNTSDLNEELGQIDYLLTDKTGTLTQNNLNFVCCSIGTRKFDYKINPNSNKYQLIDMNQTEKSTYEKLALDDSEVSEYLEAITLCHTVTAVNKNGSNNNDEDILKPGQVEYQGSSSDEEVLVTAAQELGVTYLGDDDDGKHIIERNGKLSTFTRHFVLEFDADRKCMSVVVENNESKRYFLITKGAESSLFPKCVDKTAAELIESSTSHVNEFARKGYRTLVIAKKEITADDLAQIHNEVDKHRRNPDDLRKFYSKVESGLTLLGTTGVEDELQENVPETLSKLKGAGIRIWMLTGDKMETAVNIGATCGLIPIAALQQSDHFMQESNKGMIVNSAIRYLTDAINPQIVFEKLTNLTQCTEKMSTHESTLVVDGASFAAAFDSHRELFANVALQFSQVIFCRMAPLQKAQVVRLIKLTKTGKNARVCAVGDGGNDVAMIQDAHVGIGILGREGRQAARAADFAIPQFQHLQKAILVHGVWYYYRLSAMVAHIVYRGVVVVLPNFFYGFETAFSGQNILDPGFMAVYNILFTSQPIVFYAVLEQQKSSDELLQDFSTYKKYRGNTLLNLKMLSWYIFLICWQSLLLNYFPRLVLSGLFAEFDYGMHSHLINFLMVTIMLIKVITNAVHVNWILPTTLICSFAAYLAYSVLTSQLFKFPFAGTIFSSPAVWFSLILTIVLSIVPDLVVGGFRRLDYLRQRNNGKYTL